jgi:hypothetical protein
LANQLWFAASARPAIAMGDHGLLANTDIIADDQLAACAWTLLKSGYGAYLMELLEPPSL